MGFAGERGYDYWKVGRFQVSTDNAYVQADYTTVAPKISGYVTEVLVEDNETVKAGQVLARIDDRDFAGRTRPGAVPMSRAANATIRNLDAQIAQQQSAIDQEKAADRLHRGVARPSPPPTTPATAT